MKTGKLIVLNGGSSVGKSTLIQHFQDLMYQHNEDYWRFGTDFAFYMLQPCILNPDMSQASKEDASYIQIENQTRHDEPYPIVHFGEKMLDFIRARYRAIKAYLDMNYNIIADEVVWSDEHIKIFIEEYTQHSIYFIKIHTDVKTSKAREAKRADRPPNLCVSSADYTHKNMIYDAEIDLTHLTPEQAAEKLYGIVEHLKKPKAIHDLRKNFTHVE